MYIIPAISGAAGSSIILSDNPSTNGIMLNLLAVLFVTEADNLFASLLLSPDQQMLGDKLAREARNEGYDKYSSWVGIVHSLMVSSIMVLLFANMHHLMNLFDSIHNEPWGCLDHLMIYFWYIMLVPLWSMVVVWMITSDERERKMIQNVLEFSRYLSSFCLYEVCKSFFMWEYYDFEMFEPLIVNAVLVFWSIVVGVRCHQALDNSTHLSWKVYLINVIVGIIWFSTLPCLFYFTYLYTEYYSWYTEYYSE